MSLAAWLTFLVAAVLISVSPGAGAINTMSNGMRYGVRRSLPAIMGLQLGFGIQILLVGAGLGAIIASRTSPCRSSWLGVAYLIWLGISKWREPVRNPWTMTVSPLAATKVLECGVREPDQPQGHGLSGGPVPAVSGGRSTPWPAADDHGRHPDPGRLPGDAGLCPARQPTVPVHDHRPPAATDEPGVWRAVRHRCGRSGQLQTRLISSGFNAGCTHGSASG